MKIPRVRRHAYTQTRRRRPLTHIVGSTTAACLRSKLSYKYAGEGPIVKLIHVGSSSSLGYYERVSRGGFEGL